MPKKTRQLKEMVKIMPRAAEQLKAIQATHSNDPAHVLRIDTEPEGFSLWLGPEVADDTVVGSEDTVLLRASPELTKFLVETSVIIDCMDHEEGLRLIVYPEDDPPQWSKTKTARTIAKPKTEQQAPKKASSVKTTGKATTKKASPNSPSRRKPKA
jgi:hypothetical protein